MNGLKVRLIDKKTGFTMNGIYKMKTSDCHVVQTDVGTDTLFRIDEWDCYPFDEREEKNPIVQLGRAIDQIAKGLDKAFKLR
ncbi:hypothetical protein ACHAL6_00665 [Proteiniclasticum sp. C24MP]|uniref:hypothetical protein n=1 Tax=Proteiniclasticum sp. C24MP TaxID=3374101 RepID=UPI003754920D